MGWLLGSAGVEVTAGPWGSTRCRRYQVGTAQLERLQPAWARVGCSLRRAARQSGSEVAGNEWIRVRHKLAMQHKQRLGRLRS